MIKAEDCFSKLSDLSYSSSKLLCVPGHITYLLSYSSLSQNHVTHTCMPEEWRGSAHYLRTLSRSRYQNMKAYATN